MGSLIKKHPLRLIRSMAARIACAVFDGVSATAKSVGRAIWALLALDYVFVILFVMIMAGGRPTHSRAQQVDDVQSEKIARVNDHLVATDRTIEDGKVQMRQIQAEFRDLEAQVNQWKGAEDVWLKIISLLAGGGIVLQVSSKFGKKAGSGRGE